MDKLLGPKEEVSVAWVQVVSEVDGDDAACGRRVDWHVVGGVVEELCTAVALNVVGIVVTPTKLDVDPVFGGGAAIILVWLFVEETRLRDLPFEVGEEQNVCTTWIHFVRFSWMNGLFLDTFDFQRIKFHIKNLA